MRLLLDARILLWWLADDPALNVTTRALIADPANGIDAVKTVALRGGKILCVADAAPAGFVPARTIDARGLWVVPGLLDMHVHLREPGREDKETIESGTMAAAPSRLAISLRFFNIPR